jgi:hypothetical protein
MAGKGKDRPLIDWEQVATVTDLSEIVPLLTPEKVIQRLVRSHGTEWMLKLFIKEITWEEFQIILGYISAADPKTLTNRSAPGASALFPILPA